MTNRVTIIGKLVDTPKIRSFEQRGVPIEIVSLWLEVKDENHTDRFTVEINDGKAATAAKTMKKGGDLNLVFESQSGRVVYVGQVLVEVPAQFTKGKEYRFSVQDAHEATFSQLAPQHGHLTQQAVTAPMRIRQD